jgi:lipopolysaccharide transport system ATP-binding protein
MSDVAREGRTVLFVSHNLGAINRLCGSAIWVNNGRIQYAGETEDVVSRYLSSGTQLSGERSWPNSVDAPGTEEIRLLAVRVSNGYREQAANFDVRRPINVGIEYELLAPLPRFRTAFRLVASDGTVILTSSESSNKSWDQTVREPGKYTSWCEIPGSFLNVGQYGITVSCDIPFVRVLFFEENCLHFHVEETGSHSGRFAERWPGLICPQFDWQLEKLDRESVACAAVAD